MIKVTDVSKSFGNFKSLDKLNINVPDGSVYGLIGPNGAGKTTLIKNLMGIYRPDEGKIEIDSKSVYENTDVKQDIIYISDELYFFPTYSILDMAKYYEGIYPNWSWEIFESLKPIYNIDVKRKVRRLSKGMQKQVAFWLGICSQPKIMVLDEPVDGLDPVMRRNTWKILLQSVAENGMTVLVSSHNLRELEDVCDHVGIMFGGKVVIEKSLDDVKGNIHKVQTAFKGEMPHQISERLEVLHSSAFGSVHMFIIKDTAEKIKHTIEEYNPVILDILPLSLEEVFIYELGGMGYEFENLII